MMMNRIELFSGDNRAEYYMKFRDSIQDKMRKKKIPVSDILPVHGIGLCATLVVLTLFLVTAAESEPVFQKITEDVAIAETDHGFLIRYMTNEPVEVPDIRLRTQIFQVEGKVTAGRPVGRAVVRMPDGQSPHAYLPGSTTMYGPIKLIKLMPGSTQGKPERFFVLPDGRWLYFTEGEEASESLDDVLQRNSAFIPDMMGDEDDEPVPVKKNATETAVPDTQEINEPFEGISKADACRNAIDHDDLPSFQKLLKENPGIGTWPITYPLKDKDPVKIIEYAVAKERCKMVKALLENGCPCPYLSCAAVTGNAELVKLIRRYPEQTDISGIRRDFDVALINAVERGDVIMVRTLLALGADINSRVKDGKVYRTGAGFRTGDHEGRSLLERVVSMKHPEMLRTLLECAGNDRTFTKEVQSLLAPQYVIPNTEIRILLRRFVEEPLAFQRVRLKVSSYQETDSGAYHLVIRGEKKGAFNVFVKNGDKVFLLVDVSGKEDNWKKDVPVRPEYGILKDKIPALFVSSRRNPIPKDLHLAKVYRYSMVEFSSREMFQDEDLFLENNKNPENGEAMLVNWSLSGDIESIRDAFPNPLVEMDIDPDCIVALEDFGGGRINTPVCGHLEQAPRHCQGPREKRR